MIRLLVTGPTLSAEARAEADRRGVTLIAIPPYTPSAEAAAIAAAEQVDGIIIRQCQIDAQVIAASPRLRVLVRHGVGLENIDLAAAARHGVPVYVARGANAQSVAELTLGLLLAAARQIPWLDGRMRAGHWDKPHHGGVELSGRSLGIVGFGAIGQAFARLMAPFGMPLHILSPAREGAAPLPTGATRCASLEALIAASDVISLHCPLTPATHHLLGAAQFAAMRPGALLVNTARGALIDPVALAAALRDGPLGAAGLDSFDPEPPPADSPLLACTNLVMTPHAGASTRAAVDRVGLIVLNTALDVITGRGGDPRSRVA